jgi:hypothetical protein
MMHEGAEAHHGMEEVCSGSGQVSDLSSQLLAQGILF